MNDTPIWNGAYRGGVTGVTWHGEDADYVKFQVAPGQWRFLGLGTLPLTSPKSLPLPPENDTPLDKRSWTASASVADSSFLFSGAKIPIDVSAANAIDGDHWTGWRDMTKTQYPGQWFQVDMKQEQTFSKIVLDTTWALWDSPDKYSVSVSNDGANWGTPIATGSGQLGITTITFPVQTARYIRITRLNCSALDRSPTASGWHRSPGTWPTERASWLVTGSSSMTEIHCSQSTIITRGSIRVWAESSSPGMEAGPARSSASNAWVGY